MSNFRVRPLTILLVLVAAAFVAIGVMYFTRTAAQLPSFVPGHTAHSSTHHVKHGLALITLAVLTLGAAWFTTAPERASSD